MQCGNKNKNGRGRVIVGLCCLLAAEALIFAAFILVCCFADEHIPTGLAVFVVLTLILSFAAFKLFESGGLL